MSADVASFADDLATTLARVDALIVWTRSLRDVRERGRLTKTKRAALTEIAGALGELERALGPLLEAPDAAMREAMRLEFERFQLLRSDNDE